MYTKKKPSLPGAPKYKKGIKFKREAPFPVPVASISGSVPCNSKWYYYTGELQNGHVSVSHSGDIDFLYKMGFFGKGNLSRSCPDFASRQRKVRVPIANTQECAQLQVMSRRRYVQHKNWQSIATGRVDFVENEYDSSSETVLEHNENDSNNRLEKEVEYRPSSTDTDGEGDKDNVDQCSIRLSFNPESNKEPWSIAKKDEGLNDWLEGDDDFWGSSPVDKSIVISESASVKNCDRLSENISLNPSKQLDTQSSNFSLKSNIQEKEKTKVDSLSHKEMECLALDKSITSHSMNIQSEFEMTSAMADEEAAKTEDCNVEHKKQLDQLCTSDDSDGDLFVVNDSDSDCDSNPKRMKTFWQPVVKHDPFPHLNEKLYLTLEESFFLSYGLGCLIVKKDGKDLSISEMWKSFLNLRKNFLAKYIAYHYIRSLGWVPKSGLKFGTDFDWSINTGAIATSENAIFQWQYSKSLKKVLYARNTVVYRVGPPFYHGSYSVLVKLVDSVTFEEINKQSALGWIRMSGMNRVTDNVAKDLVMCYVVQPSHLAKEDMNSPDCIKQFKVQLVSLKRWVPSQERESRTSREEEIP